MLRLIYSYKVFGSDQVLRVSRRKRLYIINRKDITQWTKRLFVMKKTEVKNLMLASPLVSQCSGDFSFFLF
jgi:hypothetical protein